MSDAAQRLQDTLNTLYAAINDTSVFAGERPPAEQPEEGEGVAMTATDDRPAEAAAMTAEESARLETAIEFIQSSDRRQFIKQVVQRAFGQSHISSDEYQHFVSLLNSRVEAGEIGRSGAYYGRPTVRRRRGVAAEAAPIPGSDVSDFEPEVVVELGEPAPVDAALPPEPAEAPELPAIEGPATAGAEQGEPDEPEDVLAIPGLGLSPNERNAVRVAMDYLRQYDDRQNLRSIMSVVFGKTRLPKAEERRLVQILDAYAAADLLRSYGHTYGYKTEAERQATSAYGETGISPELPLLDESNQELVEFIRSHAENGEMNIGEIVRKYTGFQTLDRDDFMLFIDRLNDLADRGYLIHAVGSPWYGVEQPKEAPKVKERPLASIQTPAKLPEAFAAEAQPEQGEPTEALTGAAQPTPALGAEEPKLDQADAGMFDLSVFGLAERETEITLALLKSVKPGEWFQQKQIDLGDIEFSSESAQRQAFGKLASKLVEVGLLIDNGVPRGGKKYRVVANKLTPLPAVPQPPKAPPTEPPAPKPDAAASPRVRFYEQEAAKAAAAEEAEEAAPDESIPANERERRQQERIATQFRAKLGRAIVGFIGETPGQTKKRTELKGYLADSLGIPEVSADRLLRQYVDDEAVFEGKRRGSRLVALTPFENGEKLNGEHGSAPTNIRSKEAARIQSLRDSFGPQVLTYLRTLPEKSQSEFKTAIAEALGGEVAVDDINPVCRILEKEGLVESVMPRDRGTGRTKKGTTWRLTSRGRARVTQLQMEGKLTAAEKRALSKSTN